MASSPEITLHTFFRSSSAGRLRIALALKKLPFNSIYVNLFANEHYSESFKALNPSQTVPLLIHHTNSHDVSIGQSLAALEYLDEAFPDHNPLLPPATDVEGRAYIRALVNIITSDTQPVTSLRILKRIQELGGDRLEWARELTTVGLGAYEGLVQKKAGKFSYGDQITLADVCLTTAVWNALIYGVKMDKFPTVSQIFERMSKEPAVIKAHWQNQEDYKTE